MPRSKWHVKHQHTHTCTLIYRNICAGYVKTFIVVCSILDRQRKREASANAKYGVPHATCILSPPSPVELELPAAASAANASCQASTFSLRIPTKQ